MAEVGVERLRPVTTRKIRPITARPTTPCVSMNCTPSTGIERQKHARIIDQVGQAAGRKHAEPDQHDRPEELGHLCRCRACTANSPIRMATVIGSTVRASMVGRDELQAFDRGEHGDRRVMTASP